MSYLLLDVACLSYTYNNLQIFLGREDIVVWICITFSFYPIILIGSFRVKFHFLSLF